MIAKVSIADLTKASAILTRWQKAKVAKNNALRSVQTNSCYYIAEQIFVRSGEVIGSVADAQCYLIGELTILTENFWDEVLREIEAELLEMGVEFESAVP